MNIAILHHPTDAVAAEQLRVHLFLLCHSGGHRALLATTEGAATSLEARMVLALVSAPLVAWWVDSPIAKVLEARAEGGLCRVIPVRYRACETTGWLAQGRATPCEVAIDQSPNRDAAWLAVTRDVRLASQQLLAGAEPRSPRGGR